MEQVITGNHFGRGVGQKRVGAPQLLTVAPIGLDWIDADRGQANAAPIEFRQLFLEAPQLGAAE